MNEMVKTIPLQITLRDVEALQEAFIVLAGKKVQSIALHGDDFEDEDLQKLSAWPSLQQFDLSKCKQITDASLAQLRAALPQCQVRS
jgi:hypothetical protein